MPCFALPPDAAVTVCGDLTGGQLVVFPGMPLGGNLWKGAGQIVFSGQHFSPGTHRAAVSNHAGTNSGTPLMALFALPPHLAAAAAADLIHCYRQILFRKPLGGNCRIIPQQGSAIRSIAAGTACPAARAGINHALPDMTFFTLPPHFAATAVGYTIRR